MNHYEAQTSNMKDNATSMTHNEIGYAFYETQCHYYDSQGHKHFEFKALWVQSALFSNIRPCES